MRKGSYLVVGLVGLVGLALAGCGTSTTDRALTGAGIGAGVGAAGTALADGDITKGAIIGGAAGALAGAAVEADTLYLGRPLWRQ